MMQWQFKSAPGNLKKGVEKFLSTGGLLGEGGKNIGRWHAPGSNIGWTLVETGNLHGLYEHASEWGDLIEWTITPVLPDEEASPIFVKVWGALEVHTPTITPSTLMDLPEAIQNWNFQLFQQ